MKELWACPICKRQFEKRNQVHSCNLYPLDNHFKGKEEIARPLYDKLGEQIEKNIGPLKVESLPCCVHFVSTYTFGAVYALRNKIRVTFTLNYKLVNPRIKKSSQTSNTKYLYGVDIEKSDEIDEEIISWLRQAYNCNPAL